MMMANGMGGNNTAYNGDMLQRERETELKLILQEIESLRKRIEHVYEKDKNIDVGFQDLLSAFRVVSKHIDEVTNRIMYNPKDERSDDFSRINLRHEIVAPNFPDLNLINVFNSSVENKDAIFQKQSVQDVNTRLKQNHTKRDIHNKSINRALKYLDSIVNPESESDDDSL